MANRVTKAEREAILAAAREIVDVAALDALNPLDYSARNELWRSWLVAFSERYPDVSRERRRLTVARAVRLERGRLVKEREEGEP